jgi:hypothetical protein
MSPVSIDMSWPSFIAAPRICDRRSAIRSMLPGLRISVSRRGRSPRASARPAPIAMSPARPVARPPIAPSRARRDDGTLRGVCDLGVSVMGAPSCSGSRWSCAEGRPQRHVPRPARCSDRIGAPVIPANRHRVAPVDREGRAAGLLRAVERGIGVGHQPVGAWPFRVGRGHRDTDGGRYPADAAFERDRPFDPADQALGRQGGDGLLRDVSRRTTRNSSPPTRAAMSSPRRSSRRIFDTSSARGRRRRGHGVVHLLEEIEVQMQEREFGLGSSSRTAQFGIHRAPVRQPVNGSVSA